MVDRNSAFLLLAFNAFSAYNRPMEDSTDGIILFLVISIVAVALFLGVTTAIKKSFNSNPNPTTIDSSDHLDRQSIKMDEVRAQQKRLMQDQKQKIRDLQRR